MLHCFILQPGLNKVLFRLFLVDFLKFILLFSQYYKLYNKFIIIKPKALCLFQTDAFQTRNH